MQQLDMRVAQCADALDLDADLRDFDIAEMKATYGDRDRVGIIARAIVQARPAYSVVRIGEDRCLLLAGVSPLVDGLGGLPWMLATNDIVKNHRIELIRRSRRWLLSLRREGYDYLSGLVPARQTFRTRWIQWCGGTLGKHVSCPDSLGNPQREFHIYLHHNQYLNRTTDALLSS